MSFELTPTLLLILDGWGQAPVGPGNAFTLAETPVLDALLSLPSRTNLNCSGREVGLPTGFMGNSEVGHLNIGAGRIVYQDMTNIDISLEEGTFADTPAIADLLARVKKSGSTLHLLGLLSDGGVHSHINHLFALLDAGAKAGVKMAVHAFMDGRDTPPTSGVGYLEQLVKKAAGIAKISTICGRYYAMDRDKRWDRTEKAYDALTKGIGVKSDDPLKALRDAYAKGQTDEFIEPIVIDGPGGPTLIREKDGVFFFNFRADRARQLAHALNDEKFDGFARGPVIKPCGFATMTHYEADLPMPVAFSRQEVVNGLGEVVSKAGLRQLRIAETEKYAHVTYFFNGGKEEPWPLEDRKLIPSPRDVATYDLKPQMSVFEVTDNLVKAISSGEYSLIVCNFANMDMVGHSGEIPATIEACEAVDKCVGRVVEAVAAANWRLLLTADHGNAEEMLSPDGKKQTAHSMNQVALIVKDNGQPKKLRAGGKLGDIAPTILHLWHMPIPKEMTGKSLWEEK